jgi:hypothetical protein
MLGIQTITAKWQSTAVGSNYNGKRMQRQGGRFVEQWLQPSRNMARHVAVKVDGQFDDIFF